MVPEDLKLSGILIRRKLLNRDSMRTEERDQAVSEPQSIFSRSRQSGQVIQSGSAIPRGSGISRELSCGGLMIFLFHREYQSR